MKLFNKVSMLFASLALIMGAGLVGSNDAKEVKAESKKYDVVLDGALGDNFVSSNTDKFLSGDYVSYYGGSYIKSKNMFKVSTGSKVVLNYDIGTFGGFSNSTKKNQIMTVGCYSQDGTIVSTTSTFTPAKKNTSAGNDTGTISVQLNEGVSIFELRIISASSSTNNVKTRIYNLTMTVDEENKVITAQEVINSINAIGNIEDITLESKAAIDAADKIYQSFIEQNPDSQSEITNYDKLKEAKVKCEELRVANEANKIIDLIKTIGDVTVNSKTAIDAAQAAYDSADDAVKKAVDSAESNNTATLKAAKEKYDKLVEANSIDKLIDAIGSVDNIEYTEKYKGLIDKAENAYKDATEDVKKLVSKVETLNAAIAKYKEKENIAKENANKVATAIDNLPEVEEIIDLSQKENIENVKNAYDSLSSEEKNLINKDKVTKLNNLLLKLDSFNITLKAISNGKLQNDFEMSSDNKRIGSDYYGIYGENELVSKAIAPATSQLTISYSMKIGTFGTVNKNNDAHTLRIGAYYGNLLVSEEKTISFETGNSKGTTFVGNFNLNADVNVFNIKIKSGSSSEYGSFLRLFDISFTYVNFDSISKFEKDWNEIRGENNSICDYLTSDNRSTLEAMIVRYNEFNDTDKAELSKIVDKAGVTIGESITYIINVLEGTRKTDGDYGINSGVIITSNYSIDSTSLIALFALLGIGAISAYYFIEKKKLSK